MKKSQTLLVHIHGFNSSQASLKAQQTQQSIAALGLDVELWNPDLPHLPAQAVQLLFKRLRSEVGQRPIRIIGSSLGGYYGTWLRERLLADTTQKADVKLVLINPAVAPYEYWDEYLGEQKNFHTGETYTLTQDHIRQLVLLDVGKISHPEQCLLLAQTADETLDYRRGVERYKECRQLIQEGGSHAFDDYAQTLPIIYDFFGINQ